MKKNNKNLFIVIAIILLTSTSCSSGGYDNCVRDMVEDGYSVDEAQELCHDAEIDSQIR